nr:uncharacterized protein LOC127340867 [Lolium perenne]
MPPLKVLVVRAPGAQPRGPPAALGRLEPCHEEPPQGGEQRRTSVTLPCREEAWGWCRPPPQADVDVTEPGGAASRNGVGQGRRRRRALWIRPSSLVLVLSVPPFLFVLSVEAVLITCLRTNE